MKLESPYINPINFSNGSSELETESYRSINTLNCQEFARTDYLQFIIYFEKDDATSLSVQCNGVDVATPIVLSSAVEQTFSNAFYYGKRRFNKGYLIFRKQLLVDTFADTSLVFRVKLSKIGSAIYLTANNINIGTGGKLMRYSNTYDNSVCDFSLLPGLFEYRFNGLFYKTEFNVDAEVFQGVTSSEVVKYNTTDQYILNVGGQNMISLEEERKIRHILGCNVKMIDGVEFELTSDVDIASQDLFRRAGRSVDVRLQKKRYTTSVMQISSVTGGTITTDRPVTYDTESFTFAVDPSELTSITVTDSASRATVNKKLINEKDIVKIDFGINQNIDSDRTIDVVIKDSVTTKTMTITQKYSGLLFGDAIMNKNLILRKLP